MTFKSSQISTINRRSRLTIPSMFISSMWDVKEPTHSLKRVGVKFTAVEPVLCVVSSGLVLPIGTTASTFPPWTEMSKKNGYASGLF